MLLELPHDCDPRLRCFAAYMVAKALPGLLPGRQHIVPQEIPDLLPHIMLYDLVPRPSGGSRYRTRLIGTRVVDLLGADITGKFVDEVLTGDRGAEIIAEYDQIAMSKRPGYLTGTLTNLGREHMRFQRAAFPLARDGMNVDMLALLMVGFDTRFHQAATESAARDQAPKPL
jgi:hypothetical protein